MTAEPRVDEPGSGEHRTDATRPRVVVLATAEDVERAVLDEVRQALLKKRDALVSFATGGTFAAFFARLAAAFARGEIDPALLRATHLDEYLGFAPEHRGGMVHELFERCPPLAALAATGRFFAVPASADRQALDAHERRLALAGGIDLQLLGIGRNGHVAFNEPGTPFAAGFHKARLTAATRADARARFAPNEPPSEAVTAGPATILAARRLVLAATGRTKASAVRAMLEGPIDPSCPASCVRMHGNAAVYVDRGAAAECASIQ